MPQSPLELLAKARIAEYRERVPRRRAFMFPTSSRSSTPPVAPKRSPSPAGGACWPMATPASWLRRPS